MWTEIAEMLLPYLSEVIIGLLALIVRRLEKGKLKKEFEAELSKRKTSED